MNQRNLNLWNLEWTTILQEYPLSRKLCQWTAPNKQQVSRWTPPKKQVSINSSCEHLVTLKIPTYVLNASTSAVFYGMNKEFCNQSYTLNIFTNFVQKIKMMHTYCLTKFQIVFKSLLVRVKRCFLLILIAYYFADHPPQWDDIITVA